MCYDRNAEDIMILGVGFDIVAVERFGRLPDRGGFLRQILHAGEMTSAPETASDLVCAGLFARKEAILKALGVGLTAGWCWRDIEILADGAVELHGALRDGAIARGITGVRATHAEAGGFVCAWALVESTLPQGGIV